jgi:hypothetical protein
MPFKHVKVIKICLEREFYTKHGQYMKNMGKEKVAVKIAQALTTILQEQKRRKDQEDKGSQAPREGTIFIRQDLTVTVVTPNVAIHGESAERIKGRSGNWTQFGSLENLGNSITEAIKASKRLGKIPVTKKNYFYGKRKVLNR